MKKIMVMVGLHTLAFNVGMDDYNQMINESMPNDKVSPSFNLLSRTVDDESREQFKKLVLDDDQVPNGILLMQIAGVVTEEMSGDMTVVVKKQKSSPKKSKKTDTSG